jgi:PIN domain nuclease of toxin-antitoxin system
MILRYLLDTHIFLWFIDGDRRVDAALRDEIRDPDNEVYLSVVSVWEAVVKYRLGKLSLPEPPDVLFPKARQLHGMKSLPIYEPSATRLAHLPSHHNHTFDRLLICQALEHDLTLVTVDSSIRAYPVRVR